MKSPFTITFKLKQHTPLIHFHNHAGATIRASEIKPKLDKFILKKLETEMGWDSIPAGWFVGGVKPKKDEKIQALNYWISVLVNRSVGSEFIINRDDGGNKLPSYFGNKGEEYNKHPKYLSEISEPIEVVIHCLNGKLKHLIDKYHVDFFTVTNFGTRQSKGYGSFTVDSIDIDKAKATIKENFEFVKFKEITHQQILNTIERDYKKIKNNPGKIEQSKETIIYKTYFDKKIEWEKYLVAAKLIKHPQNKLLDLTSKESPQYVRALLGLAGNYPFPQNGNKIVYIKDAREQIQRFKSPIFFKVINNFVFIAANDLNLTHLMLGREFLFYEGNERPDMTNNKLKIKTPSTFLVKDIFDHLSDWKTL